MAVAKIDDNRKPSLIGVSSVDGETPTRIEVNPTTNSMLVEITGGSSSGTEYTDGDADATPTGSVAMGTDGSNVYAVNTDTDGHLQVDVLSGGGGGTLIQDGDVVNASNTGTLLAGTDGSNYQFLSTDSSGHLQVDVLSGGGGGTQYTEGDTDASITGTAVMWEDSADTLRTVSASKPLPVDLGTNNDVTVTSGNITETNSAAILADTANIDTNVGTIAGAVSGTEMQVDVVTSALPTGASTAANQSTIIGHVDGIEALLGTIDTDTGNIDASLNNIEAAVATEGSALGSGVLLQGDDGTDRKNINVDATTGDVQVDVTNTVTVDGSGVTQPVSGTVTANLGATDNAVLDNIDPNTDFGQLQATSSTGWLYADINDSSSGDNTIVSAQGASNKIAVWSILLVSDGTVDVRFEDGAGGTAFPQEPTNESSTKDSARIDYANLLQEYRNKKELVDLGIYSTDELGLETLRDAIRKAYKQEYTEA